jgi:aspartyl-tRNA(Asn)/glutamyl-tRNA(Gln) amidotransferase subunit B
MSALIEGRTGQWEVVIGLETHAQVIAKAKLFSGAATAFGAEPNTQVSPVDAAFPGMLPVINRRCVEQAVRTGLGLDAAINLHSVFARKNYFYPDLPAGYQISQYELPVVGHGRVILDLPGGATREVGITRLHLEQDAGKSLHDQHPTQTYVDLNRAGIALMEIVSEPDLRSAEEAGIYLRKLRSILRYLGTCDGNMEEGSLRCDCNVSVRRPGEPLGTRCEIKNLNSLRFAMQAIEHEARRQIGVLESGGTIRQETRLYDTERGETRPMRSKEDAHDYRYFPDPDLLPLVLDPAWVAKLRAELPEPQDLRKYRYIRDDHIRTEIAERLVDERALADFLDAARAPARDMAAVGNWIVTELLALIDKYGLTIDKWAESPPVSADQTGILIDLINDRTITRQSARDLYAEMFEFNLTATIMSAAGMAFDQKPPESGDFRELAEIRELHQVNDTGAIEAAVDAALAAHPAQVAQYAANPKVLGFFVGQVMKATGGKANPALVNELLKKKLAG